MCRILGTSKNDLDNIILVIKKRKERKLEQRTCDYEGINDTINNHEIGELRDPPRTTRSTNYYNYPWTITTLNCIPNGNAGPGVMPRGESVVRASAAAPGERLRGADCCCDLRDSLGNRAAQRDRGRQR